MSTTQQTLLITVKGPGRALDIEVPGDVTVSDLLPLLLAMCGDSQQSSADTGQEGQGWSLRIAGFPEPLMPALTLLDSEVLNGDVLLLQAQAPLPVTVAAPTNQEMPGPILPSPQTGMIGVRWEREGLF